jgi:hypothetical protein
VGVWQLPQALAADHGGASGGVCELSFREGFGQLEQYCWLSRSLLLAGFSSGQLVAAAVALGGGGGGGLQYGCGTGAEVFSSRALDHGVASLSWCPASGLVAAAGGGQLAVLRCCLGGGGEPPSLHQEGALLELERNQRVAAVQASPCGRLLTLATASGRLLQLLASPPLLHGACGGRLAYVDPAASTAEARLLEAASLLPGARGERLAAALQLPCEPELLALGPTHLAAAQGNKVRPLACWARWTHCVAFFRPPWLHRPAGAVPASAAAAHLTVTSCPLLQLPLASPAPRPPPPPVSWLLPQVWLLALEPDAATGLPPAPLEADFPAPIRWMRVGAACLLLLGEGGRVFVRLGPPGQAAGDVVELRREGGGGRAVHL